MNKTIFDYFLLILIWIILASFLPFIILFLFSQLIFPSTFFRFLMLLHPYLYQDLKIHRRSLNFSQHLYHNLPFQRFYFSLLIFYHFPFPFPLSSLLQILQFLFLLFSFLKSPISWLISFFITFISQMQLHPYLYQDLKIHRRSLNFSQHLYHIVVVVMQFSFLFP